MHSKKLLLIILFLSLISCSSKISEEVKEKQYTYCIGNKVNFRKDPEEKKENVITQLNIGDKLEYLETFPKGFLGDPKKYWVKAVYNNQTGWINSFYVSSDFTLNEANNIAVWTQTIYADGAENPTNIVIYNFKTKKIINTFKEEISGLEISPDLNYFLIDSGSDIVRSLSIHEFNTGKKIYSCTSFAEPIFPHWNEKSELIFTKAIHPEGETNSDWILEDFKFKNGAVVSIGNKRDFSY
ncbi:MAG: hypothetical protein JW982_04165 [Spirochaetes bacterium]|nr:hypothetical protein [Spirochaetota bacterium]